MNAENDLLKKKNDSFGDDVTNLKCRSMKYNLLFFGIHEGSAQIPGTRSEQLESNTENIDQFPSSWETEMVHETTPVSTGQFKPTSYSNIASIDEDCKAKVFDFCDKILHMPQPEKQINTVVAHRIGKYVQGKTRPIVADSKMKVKVLI